MNIKQSLLHKCMMFCLALTFVAFSGALAVAVPITYNVSVSTAGIAGTNGFLNLQFNPNGSAQSATATVTSFSQAGGILAVTADRIGSVVGTLPSTVTFNNSGALNDLFQGDQFGSNFMFDVTLSGPALDTPSGTFGSVFALSLFGPNGTTPLLTSDPNGSLFRIFINPNGTTSVTNFNPSAVSVSDPIPEPATLILLGSGLAGTLGAIRRRRSKE